MQNSQNIQGFYKFKESTFSTGPTLKKKNSTLQENRVSSRQLYAILHHKLTVRGILQSKGWIGHSFTGKFWTKEPLHQGPRNGVTMLSEYIICTMSQYNLVQHTHRSGNNGVCVLTKLCKREKPTQWRYFLTFTVCWYAPKGLGNKTWGRVRNTYIHTARHLRRGKNRILLYACHVCVCMCVGEQRFSLDSSTYMIYRLIAGLIAIFQMPYYEF